MKLFIPQSIYSAIFAMTLNEDLQGSTIVKPSSMIAQELENTPDSIGLMPSCDLYKHKNLFVSRRGAISFDGVLSNSYIYFSTEQERFEDIYLRGDISTNEIILSKILFSERYDTDINVNLDTGQLDFSEKNYIIAGNENLDYEPFETAMSYADQISAILDAPYVNFVFASKNESLIAEFNSNFENIDQTIEDNIVEFLDKIDLVESMRQKMINGLSSVYYEMTEVETESLNDLLKLPFYKGIFKDLIDVKFVG